jgi:hypothetical protein
MKGQPYLLPLLGRRAVRLLGLPQVLPPGRGVLVRQGVKLRLDPVQPRQHFLVGVQQGIDRPVHRQPPQIRPEGSQQPDQLVQHP